MGLPWGCEILSTSSIYICKVASPETVATPMPKPRVYGTRSVIGQGQQLEQGEPQGQEPHEEQLEAAEAAEAAAEAAEAAEAEEAEEAEEVAAEAAEEAKEEAAGAQEAAEGGGGGARARTVAAERTEALRGDSTRRARHTPQCCTRAAARRSAPRRPPPSAPRTRPTLCPSGDLLRRIVAFFGYVAEEEAAGFPADRLVARSPSAREVDS